MSIEFSDGTSLQFESFDSFISYVKEIATNVTADEGAIVNYSLDAVWMIVCAVLVFFMQAGFALVEVGSVSMKNTKNILAKNLLDACIGAISFWLCGYAFAFGTNNRFIGASGFALATLDENHVVGESNERLHQGYQYAFFMFQFAFAATAATIVSGAVAERCRIVAYFTYSFFLTIFVYPVVVHWGWANGWASAFVDEEDRLFGVGAIDFAGSTVVHMVGGITALIGAFFLGPRRGRYNDEGKSVALPHQSTTFQTLGVLILWFGWYGFNCGSTLTVTGEFSDVAGKVAVTTTIAATAAGITSTLIGRFVEGHVNIGRTNNGILAGLVSITAGCSVVEVESAFIIGVLGGSIYYGSSKLLEYFHVDDVVDASPVHFFCGTWGTLAAGIFATPDNVAMAYGTGSCGLLYKCNGNGINQFAANLLFILAVTLWTAFFAIAIFGVLKLLGKLRVDLETERVGLDRVEHGGGAYELNAPVRTLSDFLGDRIVAVNVEATARDAEEVEGATRDAEVANTNV